MSKLTRGTIIISNTDSEPVECVDGWATKPSDEADEISKAVTSIENYISAIESLFEAIDAELEKIKERHIDDNAANLVGVLQRKFTKAKENFYWEVCDTDNERDWEDFSLISALYQVVENEKQTLLFPQLRRTWAEITKGENLTESDCEKFVEHFKKQFYLTSNQ